MICPTISLYTSNNSSTAVVPCLRRGCRVGTVLTPGCACIYRGVYSEPRHTAGGHAGVYRHLYCALPGCAMWLPGSTMPLPGSTVFTPGSAVLAPCPRRADAVFYRVHAGVMVIVDCRDYHRSDFIPVDPGGSDQVNHRRLPGATGMYCLSSCHMVPAKPTVW